MKLWLWEVCKQDGRSSPGTMKQPWKELHGNFCSLIPGLEGMRWAEDLLQTSSCLQRQSCSRTCQQIWFTAGLARCFDSYHLLSKSLYPPSSITTSQMHQTQFSLQEESPKKHNFPAFLRCVISDIRRHTERLTMIPTYFFNICKSVDSARS